MDNDDIDRKIDVTAMQCLLVQNRQQTHDWTLIGTSGNGLGIELYSFSRSKYFHLLIAPIEGFITQMDNEIDRKIDVTALLILLVQNRQ